VNAGSWALILAFAGLAAPAALAQCTVADMKGDFATQPKGILTSGPFAGPFAATGVIHFDGAGKFTGIATSSFYGTVIYPFLAEGRYGVSSDCFVTILETTLRIGFEGYMSATKNEVVLVQPDDGAITTNTLRRIQIPGGCSNATISGPYTFQTSGTNIATTAVYSETARVTFDGNGGFTGTTAVSNAGFFSQLKISGTVQVYADCTFLWKYVDENGNGTLLWGTLYGPGDEFIMIYSVDGVVITGVGRKGAS
jgi:hypothetical protein